MSFDRRSRNSDRSRQRLPTSDQTGSAQDGAEVQASRRRTSYVPRQGSGQARRPSSDQDQFGFEEARSSGSARRAQPPRFRREPREAASQYGYAEASNDDLVYEDDVPTAPAQPKRQLRGAPSRTQPSNEMDRRSRNRQQPSLSHDDDYTGAYGDSFIDEDDWYEEEVAAGAARPRSRVGRQRAPRPSISMPRPNIPRPTVPRSVRDAALVQDQSALILFGGLLVSVMLLALFSSSRIESLAPGFATHISASGLPESIRSESALWQLPLMAGALLLMNVVLAWFLAQHSRFLSRFFLITGALVQVLIWVAFLRIAY